MLTRRCIIKCTQPQDWFAVIDLKYAYFHVSVSLRHRPFMWFAFEGRAWQYRVLPFGLSLSLRAFMKVVEGALTPLWEVGVRIPNYLNDWPILAQSRQQLCDHRDLVLRHLCQLGLRVTWEKSKLSPVQRIIFSRCGVRLGEYDCMPHGRACPSSAELHVFLQRQECGTTETVPEAPGAYGICSHAARVASYDTTSALATLPSPEVGMVPQYTSSKHHSAVSPLPQPLDRPCLSMGQGAPETSVPAYCCHNRCLQHGLGRYMQWTGSLGALDGAPTALAHQLPRAVGSASSLTAVPATSGKHVLVRTDNTAAVSYINWLWGIRSHRMSQLARHLLLKSHTQFKSLRAVHIPRKLNRAADVLSRRLTSPGEWRLHPETIWLVWSRFGEAQIDLFASHVSSHCQLYFSLTEDTLAHSCPQALRKYTFSPVSLLAHYASSGRTRSRSCWSRRTGPTRPGFPNSFPSRQTLPGGLLWGRTSSLGGSAPYGTRVQICGTSMCGSWTGRGRLKRSTTGSGTDHHSG